MLSVDDPLPFPPKRILIAGITGAGKTTLSTREPDENILAWQTKTRGFWAERMPAKKEQFAHLTIVRLKHRRETERWLRALTRP